MKKRLTALLLAACMMVTATGCSMFASEDAGTKSTEAASTGLQITDSYSHEDPTDVEFDKRVVLKYEADNDYLTVMDEQAGLQPLSCYTILYGKGDKTVAYYEYLVLPDEAQAASYKDFMGEVGIEVIVDGTVAYFVKTGDVLEAEIASYISMNMLADESVDAYADFLVGSFAPTRIE